MEIVLFTEMWKRQGTEDFLVIKCFINSKYNFNNGRKKLRYPGDKLIPEVKDHRKGQGLIVEKRWAVK